MELHGLNDKVLTAVVGLQEGLALHPVEEILLGQQGQSDVLHQLGQELDPLLGAGVDPRDDGLEYFLLAGDGDGVAGDELRAGSASIGVVFAGSPGAVEFPPLTRCSCVEFPPPAPALSGRLPS